MSHNSGENPTLQAFRDHPNQLAGHYSAFQVQDRLLLTGHSHQAWPDCAKVGQLLAWEDAAEHVDDKWARAQSKAERVQAGFKTLLDDRDGFIALGQNTFELVLRFISALPLRNRPRLVTSDSEFHTLRRLLERLEEEGIEVVKVCSRPFDTFTERLAQAVNARTAAVLTSHVFFDSGIIAGDFSPLSERCAQYGSELLLDVYHSLNVAPFSVVEQKQHNTYIVGGGYKYCQLGEGNCFLRFPANSQLRPIATGWFSEFEHIAQNSKGRTLYGEGAARFAGATYDPTSHYRAAEVFDFFQQQQLTPALLRKISQHQIAVLLNTFESLGLDPALIRTDSEVDLQHRAGFLSLFTPNAAAIHTALKKRGVLTDYRNERLRFGPAPYLSDRQLKDGISALVEVVNCFADTRYSNTD